MATITPAQAPPKLPPPVQRPRRGAPARESFTVEIETVTPILGGAPEPRTIDDIDVIRVPTIRGHLRFWWRALYGQNYASPAELFAAEAKLWGKAANESEKNGGRSPRSPVEITAQVTRRSQRDTDDINPNEPGGYALWPARRTEKEATAPRYRASVRFALTVSAPEPSMHEIRDAVRIWILLGGYGSRTRRGVGSLTVHTGRRAEWLPNVEDAEELEGAELRDEFGEAFSRLFGRNVFTSEKSGLPFPSLGGATLLIGGHFRRDQGLPAWHQALGWLRDFRQGVEVARDPGRPPNRPGRSRWPEADKLRNLTHRHGHAPRYTDPTPAWPRAEFGLPIVGRFQGSGEPPDFQLTWRIGTEVQDRVASPLIVKALPTVQGFRPCAVWLNRAFPRGELVAATTDKTVISGSAAPFGHVGNAADAATAIRLQAPYARTSSVKMAFIEWVKQKDDIVQVLP